MPRVVLGAWSPIIAGPRQKPNDLAIADITFIKDALGNSYLTSVARKIAEFSVNNYI